MDTPRLRTLKNGAIYDMDKHRIVDSSKVTTLITSDNAREYQTRAVAKKRLVMAEAANSRVRPDLVERYGDYAHVAERAETLQEIATTPDAGKAAVMAHAALVRDTGMDEPRAAETAQAVQSGADIVLSLIERIMSYARADVVDVQPVDLDASGADADE